MKLLESNQFREMKNKILNYFKKYYSILIISFIGLIIVEILNHPNESPMEMIDWVMSHKRVMVLNYLIYINICTLFYLLVNRLNRSNQIFIILLLLLGISNHYKILMKGETVVFWDILNMQAATGMMTELKTDITWQVVISVLLAIITLIVLQKKSRCISTTKFRIKTSIISIVILFSLTVGLFFNNETLAFLKVTNVTWSQNKNYRENGFVLSFFMSLKNILVSEPENYSEESVNKAIDNIEALNLNLPNIDLEENPNIIMIMVESMADISIANEGLVFNDDLMPNINSINENILKGDLVVSIFGGYTANSEFEVLTGHTMANLPNGSVAYDRYVDENTDSLVGILKELDYQTYAVHPYLDTFWSRNDVYPGFGFDKFYSVDDFSQEAEVKQGYISDKAIGEKIIDLYESRDETKPFFVHSVTMQNHTPYSDASFGQVGVEKNYELFKEDVLEEAAVHGKGVQDADQLFADLVDYFSNVDEPTIILIFGDHHPFISSTIGNSSDHQDDINKFKTPFAMWTNYFIEPKTNMILDSSALGSYLLAYSGIELPNYLKLNYHNSSLIDGYNAFFILPKDWKTLGAFYLHESEYDDEIKRWLEIHELLQYDLLFGEAYGQNRLWSISKEGLNDAE